MSFTPWGQIIQDAGQGMGSITSGITGAIASRQKRKALEKEASKIDTTGIPMAARRNMMTNAALGGGAISQSMAQQQQRATGGKGLSPDEMKALAEPQQQALAQQQQNVDALSQQQAMVSAQQKRAIQLQAAGMKGEGTRQIGAGFAGSMAAAGGGDGRDMYNMGADTQGAGQTIIQVVDPNAASSAYPF